MEQAKIKANEIKEGIFSEQAKVQFENSKENLKPAINNLLWMYLPQGTTIGQAEVIACVINDMILYPNDYYNGLKGE